MCRARAWGLLLGGAACLSLVLATGAATTAALRYGHAIRGPAVLATSTYSTGLALLLAARFLCDGHARRPSR